MDYNGILFIQFKRTPLHWVDNLKVAQLLLEYGGNPNVLDPHVSENYKNTTVIKYLLLNIVVILNTDVQFIK